MTDEQKLEATRTLNRIPDGVGGFTETEWSSLSSVELKQDAKGTWYVGVIKVYDSQIRESAVRALATAEEMIPKVAKLNYEEHWERAKLKGQLDEEGKAEAHLRLKNTAEQLAEADKEQEPAKR